MKSNTLLSLLLSVMGTTISRVECLSLHDVQMSSMMIMGQQHHAAQGDRALLKDPKTVPLRKHLKHKPFSLHDFEIKVPTIDENHRKLQLDNILVPENPLLHPSALPSSVPTSKPSSKPSERPTAVPSVQPTTTQAPSLAPTTTPTETPSNTPTISSEPSSVPTSSPTVQPSSVPSSSTEPTYIPSSLPSTNPSVEPSVSMNPTAVPSYVPSHSPSNDPTTSLRPSFVATAVSLTKFDLLLSPFHNDDVVAVVQENDVNVLNKILDEYLASYIVRTLSLGPYPALMEGTLFVSTPSYNTFYIDTAKDKLIVTAVQKEVLLSAKQLESENSNNANADPLLLKFELDIAVRSFFDDAGEIALFINALKQQDSSVVFDALTDVEMERDEAIVVTGDSDDGDDDSMNGNGNAENPKIDEKASSTSVIDGLDSEATSAERSQWFVTISIIVAGTVCAVAVVGAIRASQRGSAEDDASTVRCQSFNDDIVDEQVVHQRFPQSHFRHPAIPVEQYTQDAINRMLYYSNSSLNAHSGNNASNVEVVHGNALGRAFNRMTSRRHRSYVPAEEEKEEIASLHPDGHGHSVFLGNSNDMEEVVNIPIIRTASTSSNSTAGADDLFEV